MTKVVKNWFYLCFMKRFLTFFALTVLSATVLSLAELSAQSVEHAKFMDIDMGVSIASFEKQLLQKGFEKHYLYSLYEGMGEYGQSQIPTDVKMFQGRFAGKDVEVIVFHTRSGLVHQVRVIYDSSEEWFEIHSAYQEMKQLFTKKYGKPYTCIEEFKGNSEGIELSRLRDGEGQYFSAFDIPNGYAGVYIAVLNPDGSGTLVLEYFDRAAEQVLEDEKISDI